VKYIITTVVTAGVCVASG